MPWVGLESVIVAFPGHTHIHFVKQYVPKTNAIHSMATCILGLLFSKVGQSYIFWYAVYP